jgi:hypothetical protein
MTPMMPACTVLAVAIPHQRPATPQPRLKARWWARGMARNLGGWGGGCASGDGSLCSALLRPQRWGSCGPHCCIGVPPLSPVGDNVGAGAPLQAGRGCGSREAAHRRPGSCLQQCNRAPAKPPSCRMGWAGTAEALTIPYPEVKEAAQQESA